jgi:peptidoglycan biosynthesis protein MviN/MurJ (putative lipid II flippase)
MAVVTSTMMLEGVRASRPSEGFGIRTAIAGGVSRMARCVWMVLSSTAIYLAFNCLYVITLAFASKYGAGGATVLSYAYLFASYLVAATGFALGMSRIADMSRGALADWREVIAATVPAGFRYAMLLVAPALAALIAGGATLIGDVLPKSFDASQVHQLRVFAALLCAWTVAALLVNLLLPALFALGRTKLVNWMAPAVVAAHAGVTALAGTLFGVNGVVGAFCIVPTVFAAVLLVAGVPGRGWAPIARELARDGLRFAALAAISFGIGAAIADSLISGLAAPLLAIGIGGILYGLTTSQLAPRQIRLLVGAVRPASAEA